MIFFKIINPENLFVKSKENNKNRRNAVDVPRKLDILEITSKEA